MVLINLLTLLLLAGSSSLSHAGTLRAKKGLSAGMGGPGKGATAGKGAKAPGNGAEPTPTPTPPTPTPPPPPPSPELGAPETNSACGVQSPSLTGGCDAACDFNKVAEAGAQAAVGEIPVVGNFVSDLVGLFWPSGEDSSFQNAIQYMDEMIVEVEDNVFMNNIKVAYEDLVSNVRTLASHIENNATAYDRYSLLETDILNNDCTNLNSLIVTDGLDVLYPQIYGQQNELGANPAGLLAAIGNFGQICLAMRIALIYHYNSTVGGERQNSVTGPKAKLDRWVQDYTAWATNATAMAIAWRTDQLSNSEQNDCYDDDSLAVSTGSVLSFKDLGCYAIGGPPPNMGSLVADSSNKCVSVSTNWEGNYNDFISYYKQIMIQGFTDNLLPASRSVVPLWKYQTSENIDAGITPSPVIRAATSLIDSYLKVDVQAGGIHTYTFPDTEMQNIYYVYNGRVSFGERTDRITQINVVSAGAGYPAGIIFSQVLGGQDATLQLGKSEDQLDDDTIDFTANFPFALADNERIVAVGAFDCGDPNFVQNNDCLSHGAAFKTAYVNASGAFESEGRLLNPLGYPEDGPWIVAPHIAQLRNATFLPHVIAFNGWATLDSQDHYMIGAKIPVWLYESLE